MATLAGSVKLHLSAEIGPRLLPRCSSYGGSSSQSICIESEVDKIVVLGSLNTDLVTRMKRLPSPGETVLAQHMKRFLGGKGGNQATAAARLGADVAMVGRVGADPEAEAILKGLAAAGVDTSSVEVDATAQTGVASVFVDDNGENLIAVAPGANLNVDVRQVEVAVERARGGVLVMQLEVPIHIVAAAFHMAKRVGVRVLLNAAPATPLASDLLGGLDVLVTNEGETQSLLDGPLIADEESAGRAAVAIHERGVLIPIITLGSRGAVFWENGAAHHVPAFSVKTIDTTGAGDAFVAAIAVGLAMNMPPTRYVQLANAAGAATTTESGAQTALPHREELERLFNIS